MPLGIRWTRSGGDGQMPQDAGHDRLIRGDDRVACRGAVADHRAQRRVADALERMAAVRAVHAAELFEALRIEDQRRGGAAAPRLRRSPTRWRRRRRRCRPCRRRPDPRPVGRRAAQTRGRPCCDRESSCRRGPRAGTCGSPRSGRRTPVIRDDAPSRRVHAGRVARRARDDGDVPALGEVVAHQIVEVALEPADAVQAVEGPAEHDDARTVDGISHATPRRCAMTSV